MELNLDSPKEYPLDFSEGLSLQAMASTKLALRLWQDKMNNDITGRCRYTTFFDMVQHRYWSEEDYKLTCREFLNAPTRIAAIIDKRIELVREELYIWLEKIARLCTEISLLNPIASWPGGPTSVVFDSIVLSPDNTICLESSARNLLINLTLSPETKYKLACEFCLEDCIRQYWPFVKINYFLLKEQSPLILFWNNRMKMKRDVDFSYTLIEDNPVILLAKYNNTVAFRYFWNKLTDEKRVLMTVRALQNPTSFSTMKFLLGKLNEMQAKRVCEECGDRIFITVMETDQHFEHMINYWIYMKDFISEDIFFIIIRRLLERVLGHSKKSDLSRINRRRDLLRDVWITAPDRLKTPALNRDIVDGMFKLLDDQVREVDEYDMAFMLEILANADYEQRRTVWMQNWRKFICRVEPSKLEELMRSCLVEEEIKHFKEHRMANFEELEPYFSSCVENKLIAALCQYLNFFVKNPRRLENLSKEIIFSNLHAIVCYVGENEIAMFHSLVRGTFRDSRSANKFIEELILAPEFLALIYSKLDDGCFEEVVNIFNRFNVSGRNLNEMKRDLLDYCKGNLARGQVAGFLGQKFETFVSWCSSNETSVSEIKQSLIIDVIFEMTVKRLVQTEFSLFNLSQLLSDFNNFLEWYFGSSEKAKIYKSSESVDGVLKWAFDNDIGKIDRVKAALLK